MADPATDRRLPSEIARVLAACAAPVEIEQGARHLKIFLAGKMVTKCPVRCHASGFGRHSDNVIASIRRADREYREQGEERA